MLLSIIEYLVVKLCNMCVWGGGGVIKGELWVGGWMAVDCSTKHDLYDTKVLIDVVSSCQHINVVLRKTFWLISEQIVNNSFILWFN